ncbi:MAG TPA: hypothetical protein VGL56_00930 [Fimbriimonadaceae bacterium]|jgi:hypothetical protein
MADVVCVSCRKPIREDLAFCPNCGADNRAPEKRPPITPHLHDFSLGSFCTKCGESYDSEGKKPPLHGYVFRNFSALGAACTVAHLVFLFGIPGYRIPQFYNISIGVGFAVIAVVVGLLIQSRVLIDLDKKEVRVVAGMWPMVHVARHAISEVRGVQVSIRTSYGRYSNVYYHYRLELLMQGNDQLLNEYSSADQAFVKAKELGAVLNVPMEDLTGMQMGGLY